jgi:hypothetical protein
VGGIPSITTRSKNWRFLTYFLKFQQFNHIFSPAQNFLRAIRRCQ